MLGNFLSGGARGSSGSASSSISSFQNPQAVAVAFGPTRLYMGKGTASYTESSTSPVYMKGLVLSTMTVRKVWVRATATPPDNCVVTLRKYNNADTSINFTFTTADSYKEWTGSTSITANDDSLNLAFDLASSVWSGTFDWGILFEAY